MNRLIIFIIIFLNCLLSITTNAGQKSEDYKDLSIIMPSYDKYSELWKPTIEILLKQWPSINTEHKDVPIYLVSNVEKFEHPRITNILVGGIDEGWSNNFLKALEQIKTKYVLIILDDYILTNPVDDQRLAQILQLMRETDAAYAEIKIEGSSLNDGPYVKGIQGVITRDRFGPYRTSLQTCVWETEVLKWIIKPGENIWDFEMHGTHRSEGVMRPFYLTVERPVFSYLNAVEKGKYFKSVIKYINDQGIDFAPKKLPIDNDK